MTSNKRRIVVLLVRFQNAVDACRAAWDVAYDQDSEFDGGEFSGPATEAAFAKDCDRLARRFGFSNADVAYDAVRKVGCHIR